MRRFRPKRYLEVGSGFSSAVALDTSDLFLEAKVNFTFIEPYPDRLMEVLRPEDRAKCWLERRPVQEVPLEMFEELEENDVLFIDSAHVSKVGSDVNHMMFHVLPRLKPGVIIHIHDIFYPFEYPESWFREGRAWNETYLVRAFLQNNHAYKILLFASYLALRFPALLAEKMPLCLKNPGGALWLQKMET
jgi:Methyltransferase domain